MIGDIDDPDDPDDIDESGDKDEDTQVDISNDDIDDDDIAVDDDDDDVVDDLTAELNVEKLVAKLEATDPDEVHRRREIRQRLEEIRELKESELDSTFNFKFDDEDD